MFKSLKRLTYQVPDIVQAKEWYSNILNIKPIFDTPFAVIFQLGSYSLSLVPAVPPLPKDNERIGAYWEVDDTDEAYEKLIAAGAVSHTEVKTVFNSRIAKVIDPFGNIIGLTSDSRESKHQSVEEKPSETALSAAFCRALAFYEEKDEIRCPDNMAELFIPDDRKKLFVDKATRESVIARVVSERLYGYMLARTFYIDNIFEQELKNEIPQIVFLGAGYDTRAYRFSECIKSTRIFELDIHTTQHRKREILKKTNTFVPELLSFVEINFKSDKIEDVLTKAGYDKNRKTLFVWEGVMYYLNNEAVDGTLEFIKSNSPAGSMVCFDYMTTKLESVNPSEPFLFWINSDKMESFLSERGFKIIKHELPDEIEKKYLSLKDGSIAIHSLPFFSYAIAEVIK